MERDPEAASAEDIAQFHSDLGKIMVRKAVDAAVYTSPLELPFDKYASSWPGDEFKKHNIDYTSSEKPKSGLYLDLLPALNSGHVELPPDDRLVNQLIGLDISEETWRTYRDKNGFLGVIRQVEKIIRTQKITGAAADLLNANIIARDLELFINGRRSDDEKPKRTYIRRRPVIEALRQAGIPLN